MLCWSNLSKRLTMIGTWSRSVNSTITSWPNIIGFSPSASMSRQSCCSAAKLGLHAVQIHFFTTLTPFSFSGACDDRIHLLPCSAARKRWQIHQMSDARTSVWLSLVVSQCCLYRRWILLPSKHLADWWPAWFLSHLAKVCLLFGDGFLGAECF